jgi:general secretion pathway protein M
MSEKSPTLFLQSRWAALGARERRGLLLAFALIATALLWQFFIAPTLVTLRTADAQARALDTQLQHMLALQKQAKALQTQPALGFDDALRALTQATQLTLGTTAEISVTADRAKITLKGAGADNLARWLSQARLNARSLPIDARLTSTVTPTGTVWSGVLVMGLPAR